MNGKKKVAAMIALSSHGYRHHLHPAPRRLHVLGGGDGLAHSFCVVLAAVEHVGGHFCIEALEDSLAISTPEIFNTDQGCQFTSRKFTSVLEGHQIAISMDGRGRALDNVFIERLWRTVKYENIYLNDYESVRQLSTGLQKYFQFYCHDRPHSSLGKRTPAEMYLQN